MHRTGLLTYVCAAVFAVFLAVSGGSYLTSRDQILEAVQSFQVQHMRARLVSAQGTVQSFLLMQHVAGVRQLIATFGSDPDIVASVVVDRDGRVIASTAAGGFGRRFEQLDHALDRSAVERVTRGHGSEVVVNERGGWVDGYVSLCDPSRVDPPGHCGFLFHRIDLDHHRAQAIGFLYRQTLVTTGGFGICALILLWLFNRVIGRRLGQIQSTLQRFKDGDRDARVRLGGTDELAIVGRRVDRILQELADDEDALRTSQQFQRALLDSANSALISTDTEGTITFFSAGAERMLGYSATELVGRAKASVLHDPAEVERRLAAAANDPEGGGPLTTLFMNRAESDFAYEDEWTLVRSDGSAVPVYVSVTALSDAHGALSGYLVVARDMSADKQVARSLKLADNVFQSAGEAIVVTDHEMRVVDLNPAYLQITGFAREEIIGRIPGIVESDQHDPQVYAEIWRTVMRQGVWSGEFWDRRKNGELYPQRLTVSAIKDDDDNVINYVAMFNDVTGQKAAEEELERMAYNDPLTGLPNRTLFKDRLQHEIDVANRTGAQVALLFVDLDRFKVVNDDLGHDAGDRLLIDAACRIRQNLRQSDTLARIGGDEFTIIIADAHEVTDVGRVATKVIDLLKRAFVVDGREVHIGASIGISVFPDDGRSVPTLTRNADTAMYRAKQAGRGTYRFFKPEMNVQNDQRMALESRLRRAIEVEALVLHYHPKLDIRTRQIIGFEALPRWPHADLGPIPPQDFLPLAEDTGLIVPMGQWMLRAAAYQLSAWHQLGYPQLDMAVNLSARQFRDPQLVEELEAVLGAADVPPSALVLELTESTLMQDADGAIEIMARLHKLGVGLSIHGFGMGYSSLGYLNKFSLRSLRIDRSFVRDLLSSREAVVSVRAIISLASSLGITVVADGVENDVQEDTLLHLGCVQAQGSRYAVPAPAADAERTLELWSRSATAAQPAMSDPVGLAG